MKITGNTILITGGGSGIGRALAEAFHARGNEVIVSGRRLDALQATVAASPGMKAIQLDVEDPRAIVAFAATMARDFPALNVLVNNAGIMRPEDLRRGALADAEATITTNLLGPIRLSAALLPLLMKQPSATIMTVTSGLAFVPIARNPTYCATKAAIHSYTQSLRHQLRDTSVEVMELIPPAVATDLTPTQRKNPSAMPLDAYVAEVMQIIERDPESKEICVEKVKRLRFAADTGTFGAVFDSLNPRR